MSARAPSTGSQRPMGKPAGVGIYFQESGSDIVVNHLIRGGSAERSGKVQAGDVIISIDDKDVRGKGVGEMRNFIVGPEGSTVYQASPTDSRALGLPRSLAPCVFVHTCLCASWRLRT